MCMSAYESLDHEHCRPGFCQEGVNSTPMFWLLHTDGITPTARPGQQVRKSHFLYYTAAGVQAEAE